MASLSKAYLGWRDGACPLMTTLYTGRNAVPSQGGDDRHCRRFYPLQDCFTISHAAARRENSIPMQALPDRPAVCHDVPSDGSYHQRPFQNLQHGIIDLFGDSSPLKSTSDSE